MIDSFAERIHEAYERLGHQWGWRFLASPAKTLSGNTRLAFVGLNPGGATYSPPLVSVEQGNAYRIERWGAHGGPNALQMQMWLMYEELAKRWEDSSSAAELMDATLAANFCPFRSPSWARLANRRESIEFSQDLWRDVLGLVQPRVLICFGDVARYLAAVLEQGGSRLSEPTLNQPVGWGNVSCSLSRYESTGGQTLVVRLPHLSRFRIYGRPQSREAVESVTRAVVDAVH